MRYPASEKLEIIGDTLDLALKASGLDRVTVVHRPGLSGILCVRP